MRKLSLFLALLLTASLFGCSNPKQSQSSVNSSSSTENGKTEEIEEMTESKKEYYSMIENLADFPVNFVYDKVCYKGFDSRYFKEMQRTKTQDGSKIKVLIGFIFDDDIAVTLETAYYEGYDAWDYTVYFANNGKSNSKVFERVNAVDISVEGENARLKGILGDHGNQYKPYDYDLSKQSVNFTSTNGRATHVYFPYFNVENDDGGALFAIGWGGTWQADFSYSEGKTHFVGNGTVGLNTYLKPGEVIRTPLIAKVAYYERDEDKAMNKWRKWMVDCNMPKETAKSTEAVQPFTSTIFAYDTGRPNSDGSISEGYDTWKRSIDAFYDGGLSMDYRWIDAGWYYDPYGKTVASDWWGTVGTWELDKTKWPGNSLRESTDYCRERGTKTFLWFEPERVTYLDGMVNYGYKREWALSDHGDNNCYLNNLGIKECLEWTLNRIIKVMDENGIDMYREDFNMDPYLFWDIGDAYEGENRRGITENKYLQGHYALWDGIIAYCAENGKDTFVDSCASGGGRNDLESMRRGVPLLRSDSDRTTTELRLAMTTRLMKWIPFTGAMAKETTSQLGNGVMDVYALRSSYLCHYAYQGAFFTEPDSVYWDEMKQCTAEWQRVAPYMLKDFYVLTPYRDVDQTDSWTVYEYFDGESNGGVIQAFRQQTSAERTYMVKLKGVDPDKYYTLRDEDGINSLARVKGSMLLKGIPLTAENPRTAILIFIEEVK